MNLLAHAFLSEPDPEFLLGNLVADFVKGHDREGLAPALLRGMERHQKIDGFTDRHEVVHRSRARFSPPYRRYSGIFVDIFHDHFLIAHWQDHADISVDAFAAKVYADIAAPIAALPAQGRTVAGYIVRENLLLACREPAGIERTLARIGQRLSERSGKLIELRGGVSVLMENYEEFSRDFRDFFPDLREHVRLLSEHKPS